jgi:hypothetical protein
MTTIQTRRRRVAGVLAVLTAVASITVATGSNPANAAAPGTPPNHPVTITPATGNSGTDFKLAINGTDQFCAGDGVAGYFWHTFITPLAQDPATLDYISGTPTGLAPTAFLRSTTTAQLKNQFPGTGDGFVNLNDPTIDFSSGAYGALTPGSYHVGAACTAPSSQETDEYWSTIITITASAGAGPNNFTYSQGLPAAAPAAPTLNSVTPASGQVTAAFTTVTANPAVTGYTVTATAGASTITASGASSPIVVPGLVNGTAYNVSVVATNSQGNSAPSNVISATPTAGVQPAPTALVAVAGAVAGDINLTWVAPAGLVPNGYSLAVTPVNAGDPVVAASPFAIGSAATSFTVPALPAGVLYNFVLTATYADASATATPASVQAAAASAQTLQQVIQVERPNGALILTQRCGVNNALGAEALVAGFPGFPAVGPYAATGNQVGTTPDVNLTTAGVQPDAEFGDYPFANPATYPTRCFINLGTAQLLTSGDLAGQYYAADGALNEVTVVDTREGDLGWTVKGSIPSLNNGGSNPEDTFSGNLVGWSPVVSSTTDPIGASTYDQIVADGADVVPGTAGAGGLASPLGQTLATAAPTAGLGIAVLDARIKVLIPVSNSNGFYEGILTLNAG